MEAPANQARHLPGKPGVYLFRDDKGTILYVGKASNLQNRVRSYFGSHPLTAKLQRLVPRIADIDFIVTASEQEAFILENILIKKHKPRFNVNLKDDKTYPYLKITVADEWPRIFVTRRLKEDGSRYFGPYASARSLRQTMNLLNKLFPYRTCKKAITTRETRACLKYHIKRCAGPCIGSVSTEDYRAIIAQVVWFLGGNHDRVIRDLRKRMSKASADLEFERAASIRDQIQAIENIVEQQTVVTPRKTSADAVAIAQERNTACAQVLTIRGGRLLGREHFVLEGTQDESPGTILSSFLQRFYGSGAEIPPRVLLQAEPEDRELLESWLSGLRARGVQLIVPRRGEKRQLVQMAIENAAEAMEQLRIKWLADAGKTGAAMEELQTRLGLPRLPKRMECYDISNIRGTAAVGSMVVFEDGRPKPSEYRRFKIRAVQGIDDYAMMQEVLRRRFARTRTPEEDITGWSKLPDLLVIDGGRGHLNAGLVVMRETGLEEVPIASIAKENEDVFVPTRPTPVPLPRSSEALYLIQRMRDEAHRFAISYHTRVRKKATFASQLDQVPGIGPKRKRELIKRFGSVRGIKAASLDEIASVPGIPTELAQRITESL